MTASEEETARARVHELFRLANDDGFVVPLCFRGGACGACVVTSWCDRLTALLLSHGRETAELRRERDEALANTGTPRIGEIAAALRDGSFKNRVSRPRTVLEGVDFNELTGYIETLKAERDAARSEAEMLRAEVGRLREALDDATNALGVADIRVTDARAEGERAGLAAAFDVRPSVRVFALLMEEKLRENDHKGCWQGDTAGGLFSRLMEEAGELREALAAWRAGSAVADIVLVGREAADVANFALMLADNCGALDERRGIEASTPVISKTETAATCVDPACNRRHTLAGGQPHPVHDVRGEMEAELRGQNRPSDSPESPAPGAFDARALATGALSDLGAGIMSKATQVRIIADVLDFAFAAGQSSTTAGVAELLARAVNLLRFADGMESNPPWTKEATDVIKAHRALVSGVETGKAKL